MKAQLNVTLSTPPNAVSQNISRDRVLPSLHSVRYGQLLRCAYKHIGNIMKVYIERKNMQVQFIPFRKKYRLY